MDSVSVKKFCFVSWNVQGLGDPVKCAVVKDAIAAASPTILCLQETKLASLDPQKQRSFLPSHTSGVAKKDADGSRGGIVTAWDTNSLTLASSHTSCYSLTTVLESTTTNVSLTVTNVYAPADHSLTDDFVADMELLLAVVSGPWLLVGDFNLLRYPHDKNNSNFNSLLTAKFNALIHALALHELPLLDRHFTWTNR
jgi:exonuclease III